jgi:peroxiredoxin
MRAEIIVRDPAPAKIHTAEEGNVSTHSQAAYDSPLPECDDPRVSDEYRILPPDLPVPEDDGAADHLAGMAVPRLTLTSTQGGTLALRQASQERLVAYVYPRTGIPGRPSPAGWDDIPGARGCTPQSCAFRDTLAELTALGASVVGISAQGSGEQREFAEREHIPFPLLSDGELRLAELLRLPTFEVEDMTLYKRLTFVAEAGRIVKVFYPVFPPDRNAAEVLAWLRRRSSSLPSA